MTEHPTENPEDDGITHDDVKYSILTGVGVVGMMAGLLVAVAAPDGQVLTSLPWALVGLVLILVSSHTAIYSVSRIGADR